jgi:hypothetical protein
MYGFLRAFAVLTKKKKALTLKEQLAKEWLGEWHKQLWFQN